MDNSKPVGGVTIIFAVRLAPLTLKLCCADAVPVQLVNALNAAVVVIVDEAATTIVIALLVAVTGEAQGSLLVSTQVILSPFTKAASV